jgi:hypothetical protein
MWTAAAVLLGFSMATTLVGATSTFLPESSRQYNAYAATKRLLRASGAAPLLAER